MRKNSSSRCNEKINSTQRPPGIVDKKFMKRMLLVYLSLTCQGYEIVVTSIKLASF